jgi:hypothetical protein
MPGGLGKGHYQLHNVSISDRNLEINIGDMLSDWCRVLEIPRTNLLDDKGLIYYWKPFIFKAASIYTRNSRIQGIIPNLWRV